MPWIPELFTAPLLEQAQERWGRELVTVPFFDGVLTGELDPLVRSFAGEPELHHPVRGRIRGVPAFEEFVIATRTWLTERNVSIEDVEYVVADGHGFAETVLHLDGEAGWVGLPVAVVSQRRPDGRIAELRMYYSSWPLTGHHGQDAHRGPAERLLRAGLLERRRDPAGALHADRRRPRLALEYNIVRWGGTELPPQAGIAVHLRGPSGRLAAVRMYDDADPPLRPRR